MVERKDQPLKKFKVTLNLDALPDDPMQILYHNDSQCDGKAFYKRFPHITYTLKGEKIEVEELKGWRCDGCGFTVLQPVVGKALDEAIKKARALQGAGVIS